MIFSIPLALVILLGTVSFFGAQEIPRQPLDALWNTHMFAGTAAAYYDGKEFIQTNPPRESSFESADGRPGTVWPTNKGIRIQDFREVRFWGLLRKGGWRMEGGLLARAAEGPRTIEFYGKSVWKVPPVLFHFGKSPPWFADHSYEFFLLHRPREGEMAALLKKWVIPPDQIPYDYYLRGALHYSAVSKIATVRITDVDNKRTFVEESIDLSRIFRDLRISKITPLRG
jgi:hypothetical protein